MSRKKIIEAHLFMIDGGFHDRARGISNNLSALTPVLVFPYSARRFRRASSLRHLSGSGELPVCISGIPGKPEHLQVPLKHK
jgi:hypothetical protein